MRWRDAASAARTSARETSQGTDARPKSPTIDESAWPSAPNRERRDMVSAPGTLAAPAVRRSWCWARGGPAPAGPAPGTRRAGRTRPRGCGSRAPRRTRSCGAREREHLDARRCGRVRGDHLRVVDPVDERRLAQERIRHLVETGLHEPVHRRPDLVGAVEHDVAGLGVGAQDRGHVAGLRAVGRRVANPADETDHDHDRDDRCAPAGGERPRRHHDDRATGIEKQ